MDRRKYVHLEKLKSGDATPRTASPSVRANLPCRLQQHCAALGPTPQASLTVFADLGLSDGEMARYFNVPETCIAELCSVWNVR